MGERTERGRQPRLRQQLAPSSPERSQLRAGGCEREQRLVADPAATQLTSSRRRECLAMARAAVADPEPFHEHTSSRSSGQLRDAH